MVKFVVDSSALVAILTQEIDGMALLERIAAASSRCTSAVSVLETRIVLEMGRSVDAGLLDTLLTRWTIEIIPFDASLSDLAFAAYRQFGKGRHPAKLNMGDCASYALAKARGWPLLYKGGDFAQTDIERA